MRLSRRLLIALFTIVLASLAACGGDSNPTASGDGTTPPVTGNIPNFSSSDCTSAALAIAAAVSGGFTGAGGGSLDQSAAVLGRMASGAPAEIKADIQTLATATQRFQAALTAAGIDFTNPSTYSDPQKAAAIQQAGSDFQASGAPEAVNRVGAYFDQLCPGAR
ncbi:MAG: hypothetical protein WEB06_03430 [Actinomycetota bacterium]